MTFADLFCKLVQAAGGPPPEIEYRFHPPRRWRFDLAWPSHRVAVEYEGGTWTRGRHTRPAGYSADCEKYNAAVMAGWHVLRYTAEQWRKAPGTVVDEVLELLAWIQQSAIAS